MARMRPWRRLVGARPIVTRLVLAVAVAMTLVLGAGAAFVFWRVSVALSHQLDRDLDAYRELAESSIQRGQPLVLDTPGESYQVYDLKGAVVGGDRSRRFVTATLVRQVAAAGTTRVDTGHWWSDEASYRFVVARVKAPHRTVVVAYEISRAEHNAALRELFVLLLVADLATLAAASFVGYRTARGALDPVERYRVAATDAELDSRLPIAARDDELSRLGRTFNELLDRIAASADRERQFIADASHELRSPLTVIRAEVDWALLRSAGDDGTRTTLESLRTQVGRLEVLCNALLDLEELRADPNAVGEALSIGEVVEDVVAHWTPLLAADGRTLAVVEVMGTLRGNRHWLDLALSNLVSNAQRYGAGTVRIGGGPAATDEVELWVEDDGPGFPDEFVDRAFDRFARAEESRTSGGTGLGLAIVAAVAEVHGGTARIDGSRVTLRLPGAG